MRRARALLPNLALAASSLLVAAAGLEGLARLSAGRLQGAEGTVREPLLRHDPELGWSKPPGTQAVLQRLEYRQLLRINSRGLRGPERPLEPPPGARRVLLLGDSFTEGYTVDEGSTVSAVLERRLREQAGGPWEVINAGTHGWSTDQEYLFWRQQGSAYRPQVVALLFYYNDLAGNMSGAEKPYFELVGSRLELRNAPVPRPPAGQGRGDRARAFRIQPWRGSMALRLLSNRTSAGNPELHDALARLGVVEPVNAEGPPPELLPFSAVHRHEADEMWRRTEALLAALQQDVAAAGARLVVFYVPARFEVNDRAWDLTRRRFRLGPRWKHERVVDHLRGACEALGLHLVDPRAEMRALEASGRLAYFPVDGHWTEAGHAAAAALLARAVAPAAAAHGETPRATGPGRGR